MAGLSHAAKAPSRARSLYWLALFLAGLVFTIRGMAALVQEFQGYPVVTSSKLTTRSSVPFPAITLCNLNRVNCHDAIIYAFNLNLQLEKLYEEGGEQEELEVLQRELASLWSFSTSAECFSSMCDFMAWSSLGVRVGVGDPEGDELVFIMASFLQCQENYEDRVQRERSVIPLDPAFIVSISQLQGTRSVMCYYLWQMWHYEGEGSGNKSALAEELFLQTGCSLQGDVCHHYNTELSYKYIVDVEREAQSPRKGREVPVRSGGLPLQKKSPLWQKNHAFLSYKTQSVWDCYASADGTKVEFEGEPPVHNRTLEAEWNTTEGFMDRYMGLGESLRKKIGHQFSKEGEEQSDLVRYLWTGLELQGMVRKCSFQEKDCLNKT